MPVGEAMTMGTQKLDIACTSREDGFLTAVCKLASCRLEASSTVDVKMSSPQGDKTGADPVRGPQFQTRRSQMTTWCSEQGEAGCGRLRRLLMAPSAT
jgi:hypothetical protein